MPEASCAICSIQHDRPAARRWWRLRRHPDPSPVAGWTIIDLARHAATLEELSREEAAELGGILVELSAALRLATGCARTYMLSFAEAARHVHLHVVPRHEEDAATRGWAIADLYREVAAGRRPPADPARCESIWREVRSRLGAGE